MTFSTVSTNEKSFSNIVLSQPIKIVVLSSIFYFALFTLALEFPASREPNIASL